MANEMNRRQQLVLGVLVGSAASILALSWLSALIATIATCGTGRGHIGILDGVLLVAGNETGIQTEGGCVPTQRSGIIALITVLVITAVVATIIGVMWAKWRESDAYFIRDLRRRKGFAQRAEVAHNLSARAMLKRAKTLRPGAGRDVKASDVAWKVGGSRGMDAFVSIEDSVIVIGPPRSGKGFRFIINAILDWPGPLITTSTRNDNLAATLAIRERRGEVTVFDPQKLAGVRRTLCIPPHMGCEDPMSAVRRASALVHGSGLGASNSNQEWAGAASEIMSELLLAAAIDGRTSRDLARWGGNPTLASEAVDILERSGPPGWSTALDAVINGDEKLLANKWFGVSGAVAPLRIPQIAEAMTPRPGQKLFDPDEFLQAESSLYLIGTKSGAGAAGGYLAALLDDIVEQARRRALSMQNSRLDPPLGLVLDEIANIFSWPMLPTIMADGGGIGISPLVVLQARSQAETAWSPAEMQSVFSAATAKMLLGGSSDLPFLRDMEALFGGRELDRKSKSYSDSGVSTSVQQEQRSLILPEEMRRLPQQVGLLAYRNMRPALLDLHAWIDRKDADAVKAGKRATEAAQREVFAEQAQSGLIPDGYPRNDSDQ